MHVALLAGAGLAAAGAIAGALLIRPRRSAQPLARAQPCCRPTDRSLTGSPAERSRPAPPCPAAGTAAAVGGRSQPGVTRLISEFSRRGDCRQVPVTPGRVSAQITQTPSAITTTAHIG